jgi:AcrR family transcriptional regulator
MKSDQVPPPDAKPPRQTLSRESLAQEALRLIDEKGLEGFSMRQLGARMGVEAMAIYYHFKDKGQLLDAVLEKLIEETVLPESQPPLERLRQHMKSLRQIAIDHPRAFVLFATRRFNTEYAFAFYERFLGTFAELGLDAVGTARWFRLIGGYVMGAGLAEAASREQIPHPTALLLEHAPDQIAYPRVRAVADHLRVDQLEGAFEFSMDILFDALVRQLQAAGTVPDHSARRDP